VAFVGQLQAQADLTPVHWVRHWLYFKLLRTVWPRCKDFVMSQYVLACFLVPTKYQACDTSWLVASSKFWL